MDQSGTSTLDPYEVLGISYNASWKDIRKAYKIMLHKTHPDKMGNSNFFDMVQFAYRSLKKQFEIANKQQNYPTEKQTYSSSQFNAGESIQKPNEQFNIHSFNKMFEQYASMYNKNDPYMNGGYKVDRSLDYQEDIEVLRKKHIHVPKRQLVIYKEPEALVSSSTLENYQHLGVDKIDDYTCRSGTDYMRAYSEEAELIDNRQGYSSLDQLKHARANQNFQLTKEEARHQRKMQRKRDQLEQMRRQRVQTHDQTYENIYNYIQNRLK